MQDSIVLGKPKWGGDDFRSKPQEYEKHLAEMIHLYRDKLMSFEEIGKELNIDWWTIKELFKKHDIPRYTLKERYFLKRKRDYSLIFDLYYEQRKSLNEIYRTYGFSPAYSKQVLKEGNFEESNISS